MLEEPIKEGVPPKMKGSVLMCVADTEEEVWERVKKDVYYEKGVWDKEKVSLCSSSAVLGRVWREYGEEWELLGHALGVRRVERDGNAQLGFVGLIELDTGSLLM
jgi:hypothetical protein